MNIAVGAVIYLIGLISGGIIAIIALSYFSGTIIANMLDELLKEDK